MRPQSATLLRPLKGRFSTWPAGTRALATRDGDVFTIERERPIGLEPLAILNVFSDVTADCLAFDREGVAA